MAFAAGGNDPPKGIDIIILKDPSSQPIADFSFSETEIMKYNALQGENRSVYLSKVLISDLEQINKKQNLAINWDNVIRKGIEQHWCITVPCDGKSRMVIQLNISEDLRESDIKFTLASKQNRVIERRVVKRVAQLERR